MNHLQEVVPVENADMECDINSLMDMLGGEEFSPAQFEAQVSELIERGVTRLFLQACAVSRFCFFEALCQQLRRQSYLAIVQFFGRI